MKKEHVFLISGCIIGILFRLWFIDTNPQPYLFDQKEYREFAIEILQNGISAENARLYGYPLFLATIFKFFDVNNYKVVLMFQAIIDSLTAFIIYKWARLIFIRKSIPRIAFLLYLFNPYTSAYVGVFLSEVLGIFFMALVMYLFTLFTLKRRPLILLLLTITAGFFTQIRPAFLYFIICVFALCLYIYWKKVKQTRLQKVVITTEALILLMLPFLYTLWGNVLYFHEWKFTNVDHIPPRELFISIMVPDRAPYHIPDGFFVYPPEVVQLYEEYSSPTSQKERALMANKYFNLSKEIIKNDPWLFIRQRLGKMFFVWENISYFIIKNLQMT